MTIVLAAVLTFAGSAVGGRQILQDFRSQPEESQWLELTAFIMVVIGIIIFGVLWAQLKKRQLGPSQGANPSR